MELSAEAKKLSVCLYAEGTTPDRAFRLLDALRNASGLSFSWELWLELTPHAMTYVNT